MTIFVNKGRAMMVWLVWLVMPAAQAAFSYPVDGHTHGDDEPTSLEVGDFERWLDDTPAQRALAVQYESYLSSYVPVPPMHELLTTARDWRSCGAMPYEVPPVHLWHNMVPTLQLYHILKVNHLLPDDTIIRSVYRNPTLNDCAGGAKASKHLANAAIDVWSQAFVVPINLHATQNALCQFWQQYGERYKMGLGLYATGAIHLDTQGYRRWGVQYSDDNSSCRQL